MSYCPVDVIDDRVEAYWDGSFRVEAPKDIGEGYEYYVADAVPTDHVVTIEDVERAEAAQSKA